MVSADTKSVIERAKRITPSNCRPCWSPSTSIASWRSSRNPARFSWRIRSTRRSSQPGRSTRPGCRTPSGSGIARPFTWGVRSGERLRGRAAAVLLRVPVSASLDGTQKPRVWIDTAFNGGRTIPRQPIAELGRRSSRPPKRSWRTADPSSWKHSPASSIGSARPMRRRLPPAMGSIRCWERCCSTATAWTSTTRRKRSNSRSGPNDTAREKSTACPPSPFPISLNNSRCPLVPPLISRIAMHFIMPDLFNPAFDPG